MIDRFEIFDISQPVGSTTACFPGDTPFSRQITVSYAESKVINLTAITMSPHVGTHADAPIHIYGDMAAGEGMAAAMPLGHFLGPVAVVDLSPFDEAIQPEHAIKHLSAYERLPQRVLFKTAKKIRYDVFEERYAFFSPELVNHLSENGVMLIGIDTPSVDYIHSKDLAAHHALLAGRMCWLENLDLTAVSAGDYFLIALPLKLTEVEASPVRAVLLSAGDGSGNIA